MIYHKRDQERQKLRRIEKRFHKIARELTCFDLQRLGSSDKPITLSDEDIRGDLDRHPGSSLFMGAYTHSGLLEVLERYGITRKLNSKGFPDLCLRLETSDPYHHVFQLYSGAVPEPVKLLIEIVLHETVVTARKEFCGRQGEQYDMVFIEWLCLENPLGVFSRERPRLPGQQKPGLGISLEIVGLLVVMAEQMGKDGLMNIPRHYHTAHVGRRVGFSFMDPQQEGMVRALNRDMGGHCLAEQTWAIELGLVRRAGSSEQFVWAGQEQIMAISDKIKRYFDSREYKRCLSEAERSTRFEIDWEAFQEHEQISARSKMRNHAPQ